MKSLPKLKTTEQTELQTVSANHILKNYLAIKAGDIEKVIYNKSSRLKTLSETNEAQTVDFLQLAIIDMLNFLNLNRTMNENQVKQTAEFILEDFSQLRISEIKYVFNKIKKGSVQLFEGIDGSKILRAFAEYFETRLQMAGDKSERDHNRIKSHEPHEVKRWAGLK